jgi:flagellar basal-body rod modification protein FlgD
MSLASIASQQNAALAAAANHAASGVAAGGLTSAVSGGSGSSNSSTSQTALASLTSNFNQFLSLLTTQLKNQDPSSPLDTNQFTQQLVEFAGVAQQVTTNQSLTQLIQLTQSGEILNSSSIVGKQVDVNSTQMPLQAGTAELRFTAKAAGPVAIAVYTGNNQQVATATFQATAGSNTWNWNGQDATGTQLPDGPYKVAVEGLDASGNPVAQPFTVVGTATGVQIQNGAVMLQMGAESVDFSAVQSVVTGG